MALSFSPVFINAGNSPGSAGILACSQRKSLNKPSNFASNIENRLVPVGDLEE